MTFGRRHGNPSNRLDGAWYFGAIRFLGLDKMIADDYVALCPRRAPMYLKAKTPSAELIDVGQKRQTPSAESLLDTIRSLFPLPWSAYVRLLSVRNERARAFYEAEALRGASSTARSTPSHRPEDR